MVDVNKLVASALKGVKTSLEYPKASNDVPLVTISTIDNQPIEYEEAGEGLKEIISSVLVQLDVWHTTRQKCNELANKVDGLMLNSLNAKRGPSGERNGPDDVYKRYLLQYTIAIEEI